MPGNVGGLLLAKLGKAGGNVVRENLAQHGRKARHEFREALGLFLLIHCSLLKRVWFTRCAAGLKVRSTRFGASLHHGPARLEIIR